MHGLALLRQATRTLSAYPSVFSDLCVDSGWFTVWLPLDGEFYEKRQRFWFLIQKIAMKDNDTQGG